jgi:hypothetical protein
MRLSGTKTGAINQYRGLGNQLWDLAGNRPSLDLPFADNKSLVDATTGANLVDFTRQSRATYVDGDGVIRTATTNLLLRSEEFDNAAWSKSNATITANTIVSPDGTVSADTFTGDAGTSIKRIRQNVTTTALGPWTYSVWLKVDNAASALVALFDSSVGGVNNVRTMLTFSTGAVSTAVAGGTATGASASVTPFGNGWYRVSITGTFVTALTSVWAEVWLDGFVSTASTTSFYIWGAQLEQSTTVGEYIPTTSTINSAPRFDHDPITGESLGLLVEEARINEVRSSSLTGGATGTPGTYPTGLSTNNIATGLTLQIAALGTDAGVAYVDIRVSGTTTNANGFSISLQPAADAVASSGQTWTGSCYCSLVAGSYSNITAPRLRILERTAVGGYLTEGSGVAITATGTSILQARATVTRTIANALTARAQLGFVVNIASGVAVDFTFRFAAPQLELGAFPTSYIPTTGTAATRAADVASISGSNFSSWYRQDEGTVFAEASPKSGAAFLGFNDGTTSNRIRLAHTGTTAASAVNVTGGALQFSDTSGAASFPVNTQGKAALAMKASDFALVGNTSSVVTSTGLMPPANQATIGASIGQATAALNGPIARLTYWPQRLPNDTLQTITV